MVVLITQRTTSTTNIPNPATATITSLTANLRSGKSAGSMKKCRVPPTVKGASIALNNVAVTVVNEFSSDATEVVSEVEENRGEGERDL